VHASNSIGAGYYYFTTVGDTAKHCVDQYMVLFHYCSLGATLLCRASYMLG